MYHQAQHTKILHSYHRIFISSVRVLRKTMRGSLYNPHRPAFITAETSVYIAVRPERLTRMNYVSSFNGKTGLIVLDV